METKIKRTLSPKMKAYLERRRLQRIKKKMRGIIAIKNRFIKETFLQENLKLDELIFDFEKLEGKELCEKIATEKMKLDYSTIEDWSLEKKSAFIDKMLFHFNIYQKSEIPFNQKLLHPISNDFYDLLKLIN